MSSKGGFMRWGREPARPATRHQALLVAVREIERRRNGTVPWDEHLAAYFDDEQDLVCALHARWHRAFAAQIDLLLERGCSAGELVAAWHDWARRTPGQRAVLDRASARPGPRLRTLILRQDALLAEAAGLVPPGTRARWAAAAWQSLVVETAPGRQVRRTAVATGRRSRCPVRRRMATA